MTGEVERVRVDPTVWERLLAVASKLPRAVQATLCKLRMFMWPDGGAAPGNDRLRQVTAGLNRGTLGEHLAAAEAAGWLRRAERGGHRATGDRASLYQATVPREVYDRRHTLLSGGLWDVAPPVASTSGNADVRPEPQRQETQIFGPTGAEPQRQENPTFSPGSTSAEPDIEPPSTSGNPDVPDHQSSGRSGEAFDHHQNRGGTPANPGSPDPVVEAAMVAIEEATRVRVDAAWAAKVVEGLIGDRPVRDSPPPKRANYVRKSILNAGRVGEARLRFLPTPGRPDWDAVEQAAADRQSDEPPTPPTDELAPCGHDWPADDAPNCFLCHKERQDAEPPAPAVAPADDPDLDIDEPPSDPHAPAPWDLPDLTLVRGRGRGGSLQPPLLSSVADPPPVKGAAKASSPAVHHVAETTREWLLRVQEELREAPERRHRERSTG